MIRYEKLQVCSPIEKSTPSHRFNRETWFENLTRFVPFAGMALICLFISAPFVYAESKTKRSGGKAESRTRRTSSNHRTASKSSGSEKRSAASKRGASNNRTASKRNGADKRSVASKRGATNGKRSNVRLTSKSVNRRTRERVNNLSTTNSQDPANRRITPPNVRQTVIVTPKLPGNQPAARPTLVNDIVIISEAREIASTRGSASGSNMPSIWPVSGAIRGGFGVRRNPFGGSGSEFHKGQDIKASYGASVIATADGVVVNAGWLRGYGQVVYVDHGNGLSTRYGHLSRIDVALGQTVKRGDQLGLVGSTGRSTGPHLHYEVRVDGQATNPVPYLPVIPVQPVTINPNDRLK